MRPEQRRDIIVQFDKATMKSRRSSTSASMSTVVEEPPLKQLCVSVEESGVTKLTITTLQHMWQKAEELLNSDNAITPAPGKDKLAKMVISYSSSVPHMVTNTQSGQYKCDSNCLNWTSSAICSHTLAVAQLNNDLMQWYNSSTTLPNITCLAMSGLPSGRGRKGGVTKRTRDRQEKSTPEMTVLRPIFQPGLTVTSSATTTSIGAHSSTLSVFSSTNVFNSSVVGQINVPSQSAHGPTVITASQTAPQSTCSIQPNTNPFYVRFIQGNIRMCQGCKSSLHLSDGSIPVPPFDVAVARAERKTFRDKNGELVTPRQEQTCHYHFRIDCIRAVEPNFIPMALQLPQDVLPSLTFIHREYLRLVFGLTFQ